MQWFNQATLLKNYFIFSQIALYSMNQISNKKIYKNVTLLQKLFLNGMYYFSYFFMGIRECFQLFKLTKPSILWSQLAAHTLKTTVFWTAYIYLSKIVLQIDRLNINIIVYNLCTTADSSIFRSKVWKALRSAASDSSHIVRGLPADKRRQRTLMARTISCRSASRSCQK